MTMELRDRLSLWREVILAKPQEEDGAIEAGRKAEEFLHQLIKNNLAFKGGYAFAGKRIPHPTERRRYEVDLVVLTNKKLHIIEVKNWSGDVFVNEAGDWVQSRRSGEHVEHPPLTKYNEEKTKALIVYLAAHGVDVPEDFISQRVLFMNRNLGLSAEIEEDPNVIPARRLYRYVGGIRGGNWAESVMRALINVCLDDDNGRIVLDGLYQSIPNEDKRKVASVLSKLNT